MKKNYESPKAEKLEFNYVDTITASCSGPTNKGGHWDWGWSGNNTSGTRCHCEWKMIWVSNC